MKNEQTVLGNNAEGKRYIYMYTYRLCFIKSENKKALIPVSLSALEERGAWEWGWTLGDNTFSQELNQWSEARSALPPGDLLHAK